MAVTSAIVGDTELKLYMPSVSEAAPLAVTVSKVMIGFDDDSLAMPSANAPPDAEACTIVIVGDDDNMLSIP